MITLAKILQDGILVVERELTEEESLTVTSTVDKTNYVIYYQGDEPQYLTESLDKLKEARIKDIDAKTNSIINRGFLYNGKMFSNSEVAQGNWTKIVAGTQNGSILSTDFPFPLSTIGEDIYMLQESELPSFFRAHLMSISVAKFAGSQIKYAVKMAQTFEQINAIKDERP